MVMMRKGVRPQRSRQRGRSSFSLPQSLGILTSRRILTSDNLEILRPTLEEALEQFRKLANQKVSSTDCVSFALMHRRRIERAFAFDRHFAYAGLMLWPEN